MRINLTTKRRARLLKISSPGEWVNLSELVARYNQRYETTLLTEKLPKLRMHEQRLKRILDTLVEENYYEWNPERGYRFLTLHPRS